MKMHTKQSGLAEAIANIKHKQTYLKSLPETNFQERHLIESMTHEQNLLQFFASVIRQEQACSPLLTIMISKYQRMGNCILGHCFANKDFLQQENRIALGHSQGTSQSALLAFFLAKTLKSKVSLLAEEGQLRGVGHMLMDNAQVDRAGNLKQALQREGVQQDSICGWSISGKSFAGKVIVMDLFNLNPIEYRPFLLKNAAALSKARKILFYYSNIQEEEVSAQLTTALPQQVCTPIQVCPHFPCQTTASLNQEALVKRLITFLKEEVEHPRKTGVAIFYPPSRSLKNFIETLNQTLTKHQVRQLTNLLTRPNQTPAKNKNNIFLATSYSELIDLDYDFSQVSVVLDYSSEIALSFDYQRGTFSKKIAVCSGAEKAWRMSLANWADIGQYHCLQASFSPNPPYTQRARDLSGYVLKMVANDLSPHLEVEVPEIRACIQLMQSLSILKKSGPTFELLDRLVAKAAEEGVNPIDYKMLADVLNDQHLNGEGKVRLGNLMAMALGVLRSGSNLHEDAVLAQARSRKQFRSIWKSSGYLESVLSILVKCDAIERKASVQVTVAELFRRASSRFEEYEGTMFGSLFEVSPNEQRQTNQEELLSFLGQHEVDRQAFWALKSRIDHLRDVLHIQPIELILEQQDLEAVLARFLTTFPYALAPYSGHKRIGYRFNQPTATATLHQNTLLAKSGQHPDYLYVLGTLSYQGQLQIEFANAVQADFVLSTLGRLPARAAQSQGETEVEFHGISSATFSELLAESQRLIRQIEEEHMCIVELKEQISLIVIYCAKKSENKIREHFQKVLDTIKHKLNAERRIEHYQGKTKMVLRSGGEVEQLTRGKYITQCLLSNIHPDVTRQDLIDLFEGFVTLKAISLHQKLEEEPFKTAQIQFYSQKDFDTFLECFDGCVFFDLPLQVKSPHQKRQYSEIKAVECIEFRWFVWPSCRRAQIHFVEPSSVQRALQGFQSNPLLDGQKVMVTAQGNSLILQNLSSHSDEIYLEQAMQGYGAISKVELLKSPVRQDTHPDGYLEQLIQKVASQNQRGLPYRMEPIKKLLNGQRFCRVHFFNSDVLMNVATAYHQKPGVLGEGRLYAVPVYENPVCIPAGLRSLYLQILEEILAKFRCGAEHYKLARQRQTQYVVLTTNEKKLMKGLQKAYLQNLKPSKVKLSQTAQAMLFTDIALSNLVYLEEKYRCKLVFDYLEKTVSVIATEKVCNSIRAEIKKKINDDFFYFIRLSSHAYKHLRNNPEIIQQLKGRHKLVLTELQRNNHSLLINGAVQNVESAAVELMHLAQALHRKELSASHGLCGICCQKFKKPYRLQTCSHIFCHSCLQSYLRTVLSDLSLFPAKCPQCCESMSIRDLESTLTKAEWERMKNMGLNKFLGVNSDKYRYCYTLGCKQINFVQGPTWKCDVCKISYCNACKETSHPGIRCEDVLTVRQTDEFFEKYVLESGGRFCAKESCRMPVVRISGCYKVLCTRCNTSMCFKCPPDKMIAYNTPNECYEHLSKVHGGYF